MDKKTLAIIGLVAVLVIIGIWWIKPSISGNIIKGSATQSDISLSNFVYEEYTGTGIPISYNDDKQLESEFSLIISTTRDNLYYRVYDARRNIEINKDLDYNSGYDYPQKLKVGDNKFNGFRNLVLNSLGDSPQIKVCISTDSKFTENSNGVVCKIETFSPPVFKIEVTPNPLTFEVSKEEGTWDTPHKSITIKNVGNIVAPSSIFISNYMVEDSRYQTPKNYPQHPSRTSTFYSWLQPGESYEYDVGVMIMDDTPTGAHEVKGYVYGISSGTEDCPSCSSITNALFKKEFIIRTTVNP